MWRYSRLRTVCDDVGRCLKMIYCSVVVFVKMNSNTYPVSIARYKMKEYKLSLSGAMTYVAQYMVQASLLQRNLRTPFVF